MTEEHKAALAQGRSEGRAVKAYLEALAANKPKRGRKRTADTINKRLAKIDEELQDASPLSTLQLEQERMDLEAELESMSDKADLGGLEDKFVEVAKSYGQRKGISYAAWRKVGVSPATLKRAGIGRGS